ncbi:hypothetical protein BD626DRAFT_125389 [Schizophyllum amplum]|uniref:F-box domain-containing protein n=1 Tax=Schizophyllum amplum TaxID=97359 RepID=A0A550C6V4_9AGAR|nr:hypothetical protein BD626DRAFT_125389 [Auriculariopsis ampla]
MASFGAAPDDVLAEIICSATSQWPEAPALLAAVSRSFYRVAHTTPSAWNRLALSMKVGNDARSLNKTALWMDRSRSCAVEVEVSLEQEAEGGVHVHEAVTSLLRAHSDRIPSMKVRCPSQAAAATYFSTLFPDLCSAPPGLRHLIVEVAPETGSKTRTSFQLSLPASLRSLHLHSSAIPSFPASLDSLRELSIIRPLTATPLTLAEFACVVEAAASLTSLNIQSRVAGAFPCDPVVFPALRSLTLRANHIPRLLDFFAAPVLDILHLNDLDSKRPRASAESCDAIWRFVIRSAGRETPRTLGLTGIATGEDDRFAQCRGWVTCLRRLYSLEEVRLAHTPADRMLTLLSSRYRVAEEESTEQDGEFLCPRLRKVCTSAVPCEVAARHMREARPEVEVVRLAEEREGLSREAPDIESLSRVPSLSDLTQILLHQRTHIPGISGFGFGSAFDIARRKRAKSEEELK